jgi:hypothetical protein
MPSRNLLSCDPDIEEALTRVRVRLRVFWRSFDTKPSRRNKAASIRDTGDAGRQPVLRR